MLIRCPGLTAEQCLACNLRGKKPKPVILCLAQTSAVSLTSQRKGRKTAKRARTSTKLGLNPWGRCSAAVIPPQPLQGPTDRTHDPCSPHTSPWPCNLPAPPQGCCTPQLTCQGVLAHHTGCQPWRGTWIRGSRSHLQQPALGFLSLGGQQ